MKHIFKFVIDTILFAHNKVTKQISRGAEKLMAQLISQNPYSGVWPLNTDIGKWVGQNTFQHPLLL